MSVGKDWYIMVAAKVLERGARRTGDSELARLAEELRSRAKIGDDFDKLVEEIRKQLQKQPERRRERAPDPLDFLDAILDRTLRPIEEVLEKIDKLGEIL